MRISILGIGSIGTLLGASLAQTDHEIHLHGRGERGAQVLLEGLQVDGFNIDSYPAERFLHSVEELPLPEELAGASDFVIITCKAYDVVSLAPLAEALLKETGVAFAVSNGLGHVQTLAQHIGQQRTLAATTTHGAYREGDGTVRWAGKGELHLASTPFGPSPVSLERLVQILDAAGLSPKLKEDAAGMIWDKVMLNLSINPLAALAGVKNGALLSPGLFDACMSIYREAAKVARLERITVVDEAGFEHHLRQVLEATSENSCSMLQDIKRGKATEIASLNQAIVRLAEGHGLEVPVNQLTTSLILACHP